MWEVTLELFCSKETVKSFSKELIVWGLNENSLLLNSQNWICHRDFVQWLWLRCLARLFMLALTWIPFQKWLAFCCPKKLTEVNSHPFCFLFKFSCQTPFLAYWRALSNGRRTRRRKRFRSENGVKRIKQLRRKDAGVDGVGWRLTLGEDQQSVARLWRRWSSKTGPLHGLAVRRCLYCGVGSRL